MLADMIQRGHKLKGISIVLAVLLFAFIPVISSAQEFTATTTGDYGNVTVMEVTGNYDAENPDGTVNRAPRSAIAEEFFRLHKDEYDFLVIFSNFDFQMPETEVAAFYLGIKNDTEGIGVPIYDYTELFGSDGKLQGYIDMGNVSNIVTDPLDPQFEATLRTLSHEQMHRWAAYVKYIDETGNISTALLGLAEDHWSFLLDSQASILYGNDWQDNGDGTFTSIDAQKYYSPLDLYLMGLYDKSQVDPILLINNPDIDPWGLPEVGATISGTPQYVTIDDIIAAEGERTPGPSESQKSFKTAFIFITEPNTFDFYDLFGIENIRNGWVTRFSILTDGKGIMHVTPTPLDDIPTYPGIPQPPHTPRTVPPDIEDGVLWLMNNQGADGSWMDINQTTDRDTAEAVYILKNFDISQQSYSLGLQWLTGNDSENTDYLSRKLVALAGSGQDVTSLLDELVSRQNADGGWGINREYLSNTVDTSFVLKAFAEVGYPDQDVTSNAIDYLKSKQHGDGGWGSDGVSTIGATSNVLIAFNNYRDNYQLEDQIEDGITWLTGKQDTDGGFGNSPSTVYDTALAVITLREFNVSADITNNGINYILDLQSENGSWYESPYQTALAVNAVWKATIDPDLSVKTEDITFIPSVITTLPTEVVMNVNIWNLGSTEVTQAKVVLYEGEIAEANKIDEQVLSFPGQSFVTATFFVTIADGNEHRFYVSVDPDNLVMESNEANNTALNILSPESTYDFEILSSDVAVSPNPIDIFQDVTITSQVKNKGTMNAYNVQIKYYVDESGTPFDITTSTVDIPANTTITDEIVWRTNKAGENLPITAQVDPFNSFTEISEDNNLAVTYLTVNQEDITDPNLTISYEDIIITPNPVNETGSVNISALVKNQGFSAAGSFTVNIFKGDPSAGGELLVSQTVPSLNFGDSITVSTDWTNIMESGGRVIFVQVDPDNLITEIREDDNEAFTTLKILSLPDLVISASSIYFTPPAPQVGDTVLITASIQNNGEQSASDVHVIAYEGETVIGTQDILTLSGNSQEIVTFSYDTTGQPGVHEITIIVDPDNTIVEQSDGNNSASKTFGSQDADLWLTEQYISPNGDGVKDSTQFFFRFDAPQTVTVNVVNDGGEVVRTFSGSDFENTTAGNITWDGLDDIGMVVDDGQYHLQIIAIDGSVISELIVVVDTNRSSLIDALATGNLLQNDMSCMITESGEYWNEIYSFDTTHMLMPDGSGIIYAIPEDDWQDRKAGMYLISPNGKTKRKITPEGWVGNNLSTGEPWTVVFAEFNREIKSFAVSPDGLKVAIFTTKTWYNNSLKVAAELWVIDINGTNLQLVDYIDSSPECMDPDTMTQCIYAVGNRSFIADNRYQAHFKEDTVLEWSSDNQTIAYPVNHWTGPVGSILGNTYLTIDIVSVNVQSGEKKTLYSTQALRYYPNQGSSPASYSSQWNFGNHFRFKWSPDGTNIAISSKMTTCYNYSYLNCYDNSGILWIVDNNGAGVPLITRPFDSLQWLDNSIVLAHNIYYKVLNIADITYQSYTQTLKANEFSISPDRKKIVYFDRNYSSNLRIFDVNSWEDLLIEASDYNITWSANDYPDYPQFSFDSKKLAYVEGDRILKIFDLDKKTISEAYNLSDSDYTTPYPDLLFNWSCDSDYLFVNLYNSSVRDLLVVNLNSQESQFLTSGYLTSIERNLSESLMNLPQYGCKFFYRDTNLLNSAGCIPKSGEIDFLWVMSSISNLTAEFLPLRDRSHVLLTGTAADLNFEGYKIEYAYNDEPNQWSHIVPFSDIPVINNVFTTWVPPSEGMYYVKLSVWDKAGNLIWDRKSVSWGLSSDITNIYKSHEIFSPNGDNVKDTVDLNYTVLAPLHLEFYIYDESDNLVRTFYRDYTGYAVDSITWDGKDETGSIVPDGKYKIMVLSFEFFVEVDSTPPEVGLYLTDLMQAQESDNINQGDIYAEFYGHAVDTKLKSWIIEIGQGENPQEWYQFDKGNNLLVKQDDSGNPILDPITDALVDDFIESEIESLVGMKLRITAEDFGGNRTTTMTDFLEEEIILNRHQFGDHLDIFYLSAPGEVYPELAGSGNHILKGIETIRLPLISMNVQYWSNEQWYDSPPVMNPESGSIDIEWDNSDLGQKYSAIRIKAVDMLGQEHYSNVILVKQVFAIESCSLIARNSLFEELEILRLQIRSDEDVNYSEWTDYRIFNSLEGDVIPIGIFLMSPLPDMEPGSTYFLRMTGTGVGGENYESNAITYPFDPLECPEPELPVTLKFSLEVSYNETGCDLASDGIATLSAVLEEIGGDVSLLQTLSYYIEKPEGVQLLRQFPITTGIFKTAIIDTHGLQEGIYPVTAVITYLDPNDSSTKEISVSNSLFVDRVLPTAQITYPDESLMVCPETVNDSGGNWPGVSVEGVGTDDNQGGGYELYYGIGENPSNWLTAMTKVAGKNIPIKGGLPIQGQIGQWNTEDLVGTEFSLRLKVTDVAGNVSCAMTSFSMDTLVEIENLQVDNPIISPNGDGYLDDTMVDFQIDEDVTADVEVYELIKLANNSYTLGDVPVKTIESGAQLPSGINTVTWDGKDDNNAAVPDGLYGVTITALDSCNNTNMAWIPVEVDNTPPAASITYPGPTDPLGLIVEVKGTADDLHFESYTLEAGQGDNPDTWTLISSGTNPVLNAVLGSWNTFNLTGSWTLKLIAYDSVGNENILTTIVGLEARQDLISELALDPRIFSPNNDGKLDTTTVNYSLTDACQVSIDVVDSLGVVRQNYTADASSSGAYAYTWDGRDSTGVIVNDGIFTIKLNVSLSADPSVTQEEAVAVIVDSTLPTIDITQPINNFLYSGSLVVYGTIIDQTLLEYTITYSDAQGTVLLDKAGQNRQNYTFGIINNPPDGTYLLTVTAKDLGENSIQAHITFTVDNTSPHVVITTPVGGEYFGSARNIITITGSIIESNLDTYSLRYGLGDNPAQWTVLQTGSTVPLEPLQFIWDVGGILDGVYTISLFAQDLAGLTGETRVSVIIDNTLPDVAITSPSNGDYINTAIDIVGTAYDTTFDSYSVELSSGQCSSAYKWTSIKTSSVPVQNGILASIQNLPSDGDYCIRLTAMDKLGNQSVATVDIKIDTIPPEAPTLSGHVENKTDINLSWTQNTEPDLAGYDVYRNDQKINTVLVTEVSYTDPGLIEGWYLYTIKAKDFVGNESTPSNEVRLRVDETGPDVNILSPQDESIVSSIVNIVGTASSSDDFKQYRVYIGQGQEPVTWNLIRSSPVPITNGILVQWDTLGFTGVYSIKLEAEDIVGNVNTHQISVTIDDVPPAPPVLISAVLDGSDVTLTWQANTESDLAGYLLYRNGQIANATDIVIGDLNAYLITGTTYLDEALPDGTFRYNLVAMDQAGNLSGQSNTLEVSVDTRAPSAVIIEPPEFFKFEEKIRVEAETSDLDIESIQFQYMKVTDSIWTNLGVSITRTPYSTYLDPIALGLTYGDYRLRAVATDNSGTTDPSPSTIRVTYTDITAPDAPQGLEAQTNGQHVTLTWHANTESDLNGYNVYRTKDETTTKINATPITEIMYQDNNLPDALYSYEITAVDTEDNESAASNSVSARVYAPLIEQPYTPTDQQTITMNGSEAEANSTVELFLDTGSGAVSQGTVPADGQGNFVFDMTFSLGENLITTTATDSIGNVSRTSDIVVVVYNEPPASPTGLLASVQNYDVTLTWDPNTEEDLSGYNLYRDGEKVNQPVPLTSGTATASSYYSSRYPSYAFDSNIYTYWMSSYTYGIFDPAWLQITFSSPELISHMEISWMNTINVGKDYEVQAWTGYSWLTLKTVIDNSDIVNSFDFVPSYRTDKIRVYITDTLDADNYRQVAISEITVLKDNLITETTYTDTILQDGERAYKITAVDYYGFESMPTEETTVGIGDVIPPAAPQDLTALSSESDVTLNWSANTEPDIAGYNVYRNSPDGWIKINTSLIVVTTYTDTNLINGMYTYRVTAVDTVGNESLPSNEASVTVNIALIQPPQNLTAFSNPEGGALSLTWESGGGDVSEYNLYRGTLSGGPYAKVNTSHISDISYIDTDLTNGITYYYVVTAVDSVGNESAYSNEAMGIPLDTLLPSPPTIFYPTIPEVPVILYVGTTDILGSADPGVSVEVFVNGSSVGTADTREQDEHTAITLDHSYSYGLDLSSDGSKVVYGASSGIWIYDLNTAMTSSTGQAGYYPRWSPDGKKVLFRSTSSRLMIYDVENDSVTPLTGDAYNENEGVWSPDGTQVAFHTNRSRIYEIWIKNIITGELRQVTFTSGNYSLYPQWSPAGTHIAYVNSSYDLFAINLDTGEISTIDSGSTYYRWSPEGSRIAYTIGDSIWIMNIITQEKTLVTPQGSIEKKPVWSPDGKKLLFLAWDSSIPSYVVTMRDLMSGETSALTPQGTSGEPQDLHWSKTGRIAYSRSNELNLIDLSGQFLLEDVLLEEGQNSIYAVAKDESSNQSLPSEDISVFYDMGLIPDLRISEEDVSIYPTYPIQGDQVAFSVVIWNDGLSAVENVAVDLYIWDSTDTMKLVKTEIVPYIGPESADTVGFTWDSTGKSGGNTIIAVIDPEDAIIERSETNNYVIKEFYVAEQEGISMATTLNSDTYEVNQDVNVYITLHNSGIEKDVTVTTSIEDVDGNVVETLAPVEAHLPYASEENIELIWNTGTTFAGSYRAHSILTDSEGVLAENIVPFTVLPDKTIESNVITDKVSYNVNETATITSTIQSTSTNYIFEDLSAVVTVSDSQGTILYEETNAIDMLLPDQVVEFNTSWDIGTSTAGEYPVTLEVKDVSGTVLSSSTKTITVSDVITPSTLLVGEISVNPNNILQSDPVTISYSITNVGNVDLSQIDISILTVHVDELTIYDTLTDQTALLMGEAYSNSQQLNTPTYSAKDYLVLLRANIAGTEETLDGTYFRVEGAPSAPSLSSPGNGDDVEAYTPLLEVNNASDPNDDNITYRFEIYSDSNLTNLVASSGIIAEGANITSWQVPVQLLENETYYWRARAHDGFLYGDWMNLAAFRVNVYNDLPTAPTLSSPADNSEVDTYVPILVVNNSSDPDSTGLTYNFEVASDPDFLNIVASVVGVFEGDGITSWQVPEDLLSENTHYYWHVQADDWLDFGEWMNTAMFFVNTANDAPEAPIVISPVNDSEITTLYTDVTVSNSIDPDYDPLTYIFQIDTTNTFDSPNFMQSGSIPEGTDTTSWYVEGLLDNTYHYARAMADDSLAQSPWSGTIRFFANTANDAPTTPVLANPSDGAGVNVFNPTLSVHNSEDIDMDILTYDFEVYDETMTILITSVAGIEETPDSTSWTISMALTENETYSWRTRAFDGELYSGWMPFALFMINTANDAPSAPTLNAPAEGSSVETEYPTLSVNNATDPDSDILTYDFEIYTDGILVDSFVGIPEDISGVTSVTLINALSDNTTYTWRARAYDGDRYGAWMDVATFTVHLPIVNITATIDFDPNTLNQGSNGKWVTVYIELPEGYDVNDIIVSSILLENTVPVEPWPYAIEDYDKDGIPDLKVKFRRSDVIAILPVGDNVQVLITGELETVAFDGIDIIRVIQ